MILISACLLGLKTRYDGMSKGNSTCLSLLAGCCRVPFCPEQLGGLPTPRTAADIIDGTGADVLAGRARVISRDGIDVSRQFIRGAEQTLQLARQLEVEAVFLKAGSPSCGLSPISGVTAALLSEYGYRLIEF
ncbi:DUF523 domain-containing protein [Desulfobacterota bacterium M19]